MGKGSGRPREIEQAKNIQRMIEKRPDEKFLIHCGFAHVLEGIYPSWEKTMAGRLTEYTGLNPFTINQTQYTEKSKSEYNHPLLKYLNIKESSILLEKNNVPINMNVEKVGLTLLFFIQIQNILMIDQIGYLKMEIKMYQLDYKK